MSTKPYDQAFKYLAEQDAEALLLLLGELQPGQPAQIALLPREVSVAAQLPDQPYEVVTAEGRRIVHVEAQTAYDHTLPDRMLEYGVRLWLKYRQPLTSYALLLTSRGVPKNLRVSRRVVAGDLQINLRCRVVRLWRVSAHRALAWQRASLLPFVPLMQSGREALEPGAQRLRDVADERERRELGLHFLLLGGLRYDKVELLDLIGREYDTTGTIERVEFLSIHPGRGTQGRHRARASARGNDLAAANAGTPLWVVAGLGRAED
jgi:hypothetical protein